MYANIIRGIMTLANKKTCLRTGKVDYSGFRHPDIDVLIKPFSPAAERLPGILNAADSLSNLSMASTGASFLFTPVSYKTRL